MDKKISFIIPVYNADKYIKRSIDIILKVNYVNYDIIVVNDGSTDHTKDILESIDSPFVKVIHQKNSGVSEARNTGIRNTDADYIIFVDVDDFIIPEKIDEILELIQFDKDIYMFAYEHQEDNIFYKIPLPISEGNYESDSICKLSDRLIDVKYSKKYKSGYFGAKIYQYIFSSDLLKRNNLMFPSGIHFAEDCVFCYSVFKVASSMSVIDITAYHYIVYDDSASHKYRKDFWNEIKQFYKEICKINKGDISNKSQFFFYYFNDIIGRAVKNHRIIGEKDVCDVISSLYNDTEYHKAVSIILKDDMTTKEKLLLWLYKNKYVKLTYIVYLILLSLRIAKNRINKKNTQRSF